MTLKPPSSSIFQAFSDAFFWNALRIMHSIRTLTHGFYLQKILNGQADNKICNLLNVILPTIVNELVHSMTLKTSILEISSPKTYDL